MEREGLYTLTIGLEPATQHEVTTSPFSSPMTNMMREEVLEATPREPCEFD
jgi:hypothetical protein